MHELIAADYAKIVDCLLLLVTELMLMVLVAGN